MKKKGQSEVLITTLLFELIIGVLIAGILMYALLNINNASKFSKDYIQQDLDLVKEMVRSLPGDLEMHYKTGSLCYKEGGAFTQEATNCGIKITKTGDEIKIEGVKIKEDEKRSV